MMVKVLQLLKISYLLVVLVILIWLLHQYVYHGSTLSHVATVTENHFQKADETNSVVSQQSQPTSEHTTKNSERNRDSRSNTTHNYIYPKQTTEQGAALVKSSFKSNHYEEATITPPHFHQPNVSKPPAVVHKINNIKSTEIEKFRVRNIRPSARMTGYIIGVSFWDQQTFSVGNILSLQCWAGHYDMVVAEPFMIDTKFGAPLTAEAMKHNDTMVRLGRLYDLDHWNEYSKKRGYAQMVEWKRFLLQAPRNVIIVEVNADHRSCFLPTKKQEYSRTLAAYGFKIVKDLCLEQRRDLREKMSLDNFATSIFGNYTPSDVTVVFTEWSGRILSQFVNLGEAHCHSSRSTFDVISPSKDIRDNANTYIQQQFGGNNYIAIMLRIEWMMVTIHPQTLPSCLEQTLKRLQLIQNKTLLNSTFIAIDVGRFGSKTSGRLNSDAVLEPVQALFRTVYGNSSSLQQWESTFEIVANKHPSPGYVGYLQKEIAIRAKCILLIGGGTFQKHALRMYKELHRGTSNSCYAAAESKCDITASEGINLD